MIINCHMNFKRFVTSRDFIAIDSIQGPNESKPCPLSSEFLDAFIQSSTLSVRNIASSLFLYNRYPIVANGINSKSYSYLIICKSRHGECIRIIEEAINKALSKPVTGNKIIPLEAIFSRADSATETMVAVQEYRGLKQE